ncbi:ABC transporter ATP-binding protein [Gemella sp. GH3]|uniref:ATP-binding cassette domain-containing protein n=1 Tax=unclassified Gemella TaxID=2624949 RepID=UPI0015D013BB|nr:MULTISPECIES: ABC transporter ATP-binding protein [unclassified Gemella]MBF0714148.1 ABC transporter ATP-binding protein [Gemella sp. GH3.1]NYS51100.1 ABC transporter ATP-binding protein [Gemella sp. GH3]
MIDFKSFNYKYDNSEQMNIEDLTLNIQKGECILITGNSGCGKTSLLRILNGLAPHYYSGGFSGEFRIANLGIGDSISEFSKIVGSVFQNPKNQFFHLDSTSELAFSMENFGFTPQEILSKIKFISQKFNAENLLDRNILELSGGEKQKLAFMASMMLDADIYVLDEITSNLDLKSIKLIADIIKVLKDNGKTIVIAEHRIYYLRDIVDRMYILKEGKLLHHVDKYQLKDFDGTHCHTRQLDLKKVVIKEKEQKNYKKDYLILENVSYKVNNKDIVHKRETFSTGNVYAIIGENGCGKTTFANVISGFVKHKGNIILDGQVINKNNLLKNCFQVMQDVNYQLFTNSVVNELKLGCKDFDNFDYVIDKLNIRNILDRHPNTLSGGEKQRVVIASAILSEKKILIFDEPTSGLDYKNMIYLSNLIRNVSKENDVVIFVITHDYEFLCNVADSVLMFDTNGISESIEVIEKNKNKILSLMN